jgi:hypothetical protein
MLALGWFGLRGKPVHLCGQRQSKQADTEFHEVRTERMCSVFRRCGKGARLAWAATRYGDAVGWFGRLIEEKSTFCAAVVSRVTCAPSLNKRVHAMTPFTNDRQTTLAAD